MNHQKKNRKKKKRNEKDDDWDYSCIIIRFLIPEFSFLLTIIQFVPCSVLVPVSTIVSDTYLIRKSSYRCCCHLERELCIASRVIMFREPEGLIKFIGNVTSGLVSIRTYRKNMITYARALLTLRFRQSTELFIRGNLKIETRYNIISNTRNGKLRKFFLIRRYYYQAQTWSKFLINYI